MRDESSWGGMENWHAGHDTTSLTALHSLLHEGRHRRLVKINRHHVVGYLVSCTHCCGRVGRVCCMIVTIILVETRTPCLRRRFTACEDVGRLPREATLSLVPPNHHASLGNIPGVKGSWQTMFVDK